jgi:hypothetical protein
MAAYRVLPGYYPPPWPFPWPEPAPRGIYLSERRDAVPSPWRETPEPIPWRENPDPVPWSVSFLVSAVSSKVAAANMTNETAAQQIIAAADGAITAFIDSDDICPRWPYPGPPPWLSIIASELTLVANSFPEGALRTGILQVAGHVLDRVALNPQPLPPGEKGPQ